MHVKGMFRTFKKKEKTKQTIVCKIRVNMTMSAAEKHLPAPLKLSE